ncbi:hypothetical protein V7183_21305, partial [Bacillus sp. JJ1127]|uniref:hypothetical protein n=1 Tax=Bacillus sp. JJ1127 TaxID=3122952 RepID=UPI003000C34F
MKRLTSDNKTKREQEGVGAFDREALFASLEEAKRLTVLAVETRQNSSQIVKIKQRKHPYLGVFSELIKRLFKLRNLFKQTFD